MAKNKSGLENVAKILILIDGILRLLGAVVGILNEIGQSFSDPLGGVPGQGGFGAGQVGLGGIVYYIIAIIIAIVYILHFTGKIDGGSALVNAILFIILGYFFGGILTIIGGILYLIAALTSS